MSGNPKMDMIGKSCIIGAFVTYQWKIKNGLDICNKDQLVC